MSLSHLPDVLSNAFDELAHWLDRRSAARLPGLLYGALFGRGRRTVTSWFRAAGITEDFRQADVTVCVAGRRIDHLAISTVGAVTRLLDRGRLLLAIDDTPTPRWGPQVEGEGTHHHPAPGPAGERYVYGHVGVTLAARADHPECCTLALPVQARLYIRKADVEKLPPERSRPFRTKLQLAAEQLRWLKPWVDHRFHERWGVVDGGFAKKPFLKPAAEGGYVVVGRLRKDAALRSLPGPKPPSRRGPQATYGKDHLSLAKRAGQSRGWQQVTCVQYGEEVTKTVKSFVATWRPASGAVRVVIVQEDDGWLPYFCTGPDASAEEVLEAAADRGAIEQAFKDVKEVGGAGQQQVRNVYSSEACFNVNLWMYRLVEAWAWDKEEEAIVDRSDCPWDNQPRRASHADKRQALQREVLRAEIHEALAGRPTKQRIHELGLRLLALAA